MLLGTFLISTMAPWYVSAETLETVTFEEIYRDYDEDSGDFTDLEPGDSLELLDYVDQIHYWDEGGYTEMWFESTGSGLYSTPSLKLTGDLTKEISRNDKIKVVVTVVDAPYGNKTVERLNADVGSTKVVIEGDDDIILDSETINILGYEIKMTALPENLQTPWFKFAIVMAAWVLITLVVWVIIRVLVKIADRTKTDLDKKLIRIVKLPFFIIVLLYGVILSVTMLEPSDTVLRILTIAYRSLTIILIAVIAVKVFHNVIMLYLKILSRKTETEADDVLVPVIGKIVTVVVWIIAGILFLDTFGVDVTVFVAGMGIAGLVIALAAQDTLSNFFSGIMILLDRPFKEGDWILMDDKVYQVRNIGLRSTRLLHSFSNQLVTIPNNRISDHIFSNLNEPDFLGRITVSVGVSYKSDPDKVAEILMDVVKKHPETYQDQDHSNFYRFNEFGDSSLLFAVTFWVKDFNDQWRIASDVRRTIYKRFEEEDIEIPFPQRVVHFDHGPIPSPRPGGKNQPPVHDMGNLSPD